METVAYLEMAQDQENLEPKELKFSSKAVATVVTVAGTAWAGGLLTAAPAMAYGYGCCRPVIHRPISCCRPVHRPVYYPVSSCYQSCYYPQPKYEHHDSGSYYPDYYSKDHGYDHGYEKPHYSDHGGGYHEIAYHPVTDPNLLKLGSVGDPVAQLQQTLLDLGYDVGEVDGLYGPSTKAAVLHYQADAGLAQDGIAGEETLGSLGLLIEPAVVS
jgi:hypothetical protein